jgi:hypothetical protein
MPASRSAPPPVKLLVVKVVLWRECALLLNVRMEGGGGGGEPPKPQKALLAYKNHANALKNSL